MRYQAEPIALALRERRIPYEVRGATDLFAREEVRDVTAYLRLAGNLDDAEAMRRILDRPTRNLGSLARRLREDPAPASDIPRYARLWGERAHEEAARLLDTLKALSDAAATKGPLEMIELVLESTGYAEWLRGRADGEE
ncbi:MAG: 3'-5' exonuclease, partial [Chloroflexia bacterium]